MCVTAMIYEAAGCPSMPGDETGVCRMCGRDDVGQVFESWVRPTFNDWDKLQSGTIICRACLFCCDEASEALARAVGKDTPQRMRNYSHFVVGGAWLPLSKGDKVKMAVALLAGPDVAVVALSGQKHLAFRAQPGWWQIEESTSRPFPTDLAGLLPLTTELYSGGISKSEIESGHYQQYRVIRFGFDRWRDLEAALRSVRGSLPFQVAVFLTQKIEEEENARNGEIAIGPDLAGYTAGLQTEICPGNLGTIRGQCAQRGVHVQPEQVFQYDLFAPPSRDSE